jgi:hypothetical protein
MLAYQQANVRQSHRGPNAIVYDGTNPANVLQNFNAYSLYFQRGVRVAATESTGPP